MECPLRKDPSPPLIICCHYTVRVVRAEVQVTEMMTEKRPLLRVKNLSKQFDGVTVLDNVFFDLYPGEGHVLFGENGAGKSTFTKILCGGYTADAGEIYVDGEKVSIRGPSHARALGIVAVHQDFGLIPQLTVVDNIYLGREFKKQYLLDKKAMEKEAKDYLKSLALGFEISLHEKIKGLTMAEQQIVAIVKALLQPLKILILDEPTSAFTQRETEMLFDHIARLKQRGIGIIYISHVVEELKTVGDRVTILCDGKVVGVIQNNSDITKENLLKGMVRNKKTSEEFPELGRRADAVTLDVHRLSTRSGLQEITFQVREGEILGIGGLPDSGKSILGRALFGLEKVTAGKICVKGKNIESKLNPSVALRNNVMYFPGEKMEAVVLCRSIKENQTLPTIRERFSRKGIIKKSEERRASREQIQSLSIKPSDMERRMRFLSGGNQQKVLFSRGLLKKAEIFIFDDITRGIDIASKIEFYRLVHELAERGATVVYISSEVNELLNLCHRIMVMYNKKIFEVVEHEAASREKLLHYILGLKEGMEPPSFPTDKGGD
jgi:ribose transport system ATP-binding protein